MEFENLQAQYEEIMAAFDGKDRKKVNETGRPFTREYLTDVVFKLKDICQDMFKLQTDAKTENDILEKATNKIVDKCFTKIEQKITSIQDEACDEDDSSENSSVPSKATFASILKSNCSKTFARTIAQDAVVQYNKEEIEKKSRENNVMIFKMPESLGVDDVVSQENDKQFFKELCDDALKLNDLKIKEVTRLGKEAKSDKIRPVKVTFQNNFDKRKFMSKLSSLREAGEKFQNVSITHDLSDSEREAVKALLKEAEKKNGQEQTKNFVWKVRGTPGNMRLMPLKARV